jgi:ankyrin repeat protein
MIIKFVTLVLTNTAHMNHYRNIGLRGTTSLHRACQEDDLKHLRKFLSENDDYDVDTTDREGYPAVYYACQQGNLEALELLVNAGANIQFRDAEGWTLLHECCQHGHVDCFQYLLDKGIDYTRNNIENKGPLEYCDNFHRESLVAKLESHRSMVEIKDPGNN